MSESLTFKRLCDAAVTAGEMSQGTADYFHGLYLNSDECRDLAALRDPLTGEDYFIGRDVFVKYVAEKVNPARAACGLSTVTEGAASQLYDVLIHRRHRQ